MYEQEVKRLQEMIDDSCRIVFLAARGYPRRAIYRIFAAPTGYTGRSTGIPLRRS